LTEPRGAGAFDDVHDGRREVKACGAWATFEERLADTCLGQPIHGVEVVDHRLCSFQHSGR
jgi:hypothetical protein